MKKIKTLITLLLVVIACSSVDLFAGENYPFYFFRLKPTKMKNLLSREEAQKELCKIVAKNCEIPPDSAYDYPPELKTKVCKVVKKCDFPKDKKLRFSIQKLYKSADEKSEIVGAFVNASSGLDDCFNFAEHCYISALASFVINKNGEKKELNHYVSRSSDEVEKLSDFDLFRKIGAGEVQSSYFAYVRAMDAIPNDPLSYHVKPTMHWYALANPDESGSKMWFQYKSDLRTPKYGILRTNEVNKDFQTKLDDRYNNQHLMSKPYMICRMYGDSKLSIVFVKRGSFDTYVEESTKHNVKSFKGFSNGDPVCDSKEAEPTIHETVLDVKEFYENGFLKKGFTIFGIEYTDYVEYQESVPVYSVYHNVITKKKEKMKTEIE